jgi:hypothetical protein
MNGGMPIRGRHLATPVFGPSQHVYEKPKKHPGLSRERHSREQTRCEGRSRKKKVVTAQEVENSEEKCEAERDLFADPGNEKRGCGEDDTSAEGETGASGIRATLGRLMDGFLRPRYARNVGLAASAQDLATAPPEVGNSHQGPPHNGSGPAVPKRSAKARLANVSPQTEVQERHPFVQRQGAGEASPRICPGQDSGGGVRLAELNQHIQGDSSNPDTSNVSPNVSAQVAIGAPVIGSGAVGGTIWSASEARRNRLTSECTLEHKKMTDWLEWSRKHRGEAHVEYNKALNARIRQLKDDRIDATKATSLVIEEFFSPVPGCNIVEVPRDLRAWISQPFHSTNQSANVNGDNSVSNETTSSRAATEEGSGIATIRGPLIPDASNTPSSAEILQDAPTNASVTELTPPLRSSSTPSSTTHARSGEPHRQNQSAGSLGRIEHFCSSGKPGKVCSSSSRQELEPQAANMRRMKQE